MQKYLFPVPFAILGGVAVWIIVFLKTYSNFTKMEQQKRIMFSITSAGIIAIILILLVVIVMYFLMKIILK